MEILFPNLRNIFFILTNWFIVEVFLFITVIIILCFIPKNFLNSAFIKLQKLNQWFSRLAEKKYLPYIAIISYSFSLCVILSIIQKPLPRVADEFGYLLGADTFLNGRLTNPSHPLWQHFESLQILTTPIYMPRYPPGQFIILAFGKFISGKWIAGVWISFTLGAASICWMLQAYTNRKWALIGGLGVATSGHILLEWGMGFWGGALAMIGGALVFGAIARLFRVIKTRYAILMGLGFVILLYTRPYEGFVASSTILIPLIAWLIYNVKNTPGGFWSGLFIKLIFPTAFILIVGISWFGYYNYKNTGDPLKMPYTLYDPQYETARAFIFQEPHEKPIYRHAEMEKFHTIEAKKFAQRSTLSGFFKGVLFKIWDYWRFYISITFLIPLSLFIFKKKNFWEKYALFVVFLVLLSNALSTWEDSHYLAPIACLIVFIICQGCREVFKSGLLSLRQSQIIGLTITIVFLITPFLAAASHWKILNQSFAAKRSHIEEYLKGQEGNHLIIVQYNTNHMSSSEWVYNESGIDEAKVIWARDMGEEKNKELLEYFGDRSIWIINADDNIQLNPL